MLHTRQIIAMSEILDTNKKETASTTDLNRIPRCFELCQTQQNIIHTLAHNHIYQFSRTKPTITALWQKPIPIDNGIRLSSIQFHRRANISHYVFQRLFPSTIFGKHEKRSNQTHSRLACCSISLLSEVFDRDRGGR